MVINQRNISIISQVTIKLIAKSENGSLPNCPIQNFMACSEICENEIVGKISLVHEFQEFILYGKGNDVLPLAVIQWEIVGEVSPYSSKEPQEQTLQVAFWDMLTQFQFCFWKMEFSTGASSQYLSWFDCLSIPKLSPRKSLTEHLGSIVVLLARHGLQENWNTFFHPLRFFFGLIWLFFIACRFMFPTRRVVSERGCLL